MAAPDNPQPLDTADALPSVLAPIFRRALARGLDAMAAEAERAREAEESETKRGLAQGPRAKELGTGDETCSSSAPPL